MADVNNDIYIIDEYKEKFNNMLNTTVEDSIKDYSILISMAIDSEVYESAMNALNESIEDPAMLMMFNYVFSIIRGIIVGIDVECLITKFNNFSEFYRLQAMQYIDAYISDVYKGILHDKLNFGKRK